MGTQIKDAKTPLEALEWVREVFDARLFMNDERDYRQVMAFEVLLDKAIDGKKNDGQG